MADAPRKRRWPWIVGTLIVLAAVGGLWINRQLEPERLTALVLARAGEALGLELTIDGTPEYALRPEPRLLLPGLSVRQPGAATPLLHAARAEVSLPWDTIMGGESLVITRVELERPVLDLAALAAWQATRPEAPFELPTFTRGLQVVDGTVLGDGWALDMLGLEIDELLPGEPAAAGISGQFERGSTFVLFEGELELAKAGLVSGFKARLEGKFRDQETEGPFTLALDGDIDAAQDLRFAFADIALSAAPLLPDIAASGTATFGETTALSLQGQLASWPADWPVLPEPLSASTSPLDFTLGYEGAADFSAPMALTLVRDETRIESTLALAAVLAWLDSDGASPLPPLTGKLDTPSVVIGGVTLEGLRIQIEEDEAADPAADIEAAAASEVEADTRPQAEPKP